MKGKVLSILTVLALVGYLPLFAQVPEEPVAPPEEQATEPLPEAQTTAPGETYEAQPMGTEGEIGAAEEPSLPEEELPATASPLPLLFLAGGASLASGLALRWRLRK